MKTLKFAGRKIRLESAIVRAIGRRNGNDLMLIKGIVKDGENIDHAWIKMSKNPKMRGLKVGDEFEAMGFEYEYIGLDDSCNQITKIGFMGLRPVRKVK